MRGFTGWKDKSQSSVWPSCMSNYGQLFRPLGTRQHRVAHFMMDQHIQKGIHIHHSHDSHRMCWSIMKWALATLCWRAPRGRNSCPQLLMMPRHCFVFCLFIQYSKTAQCWLSWFRLYHSRCFIIYAVWYIPHPVFHCNECIYIYIYIYISGFLCSAAGYISRIDSLRVSLTPSARSYTLQLHMLQNTFVNLTNHDIGRLYISTSGYMLFRCIPRIYYELEISMSW